MESSMNDEVVTRLYRRLVEELRSRGHAADEPLKVSDLYQDLVPYRSVRSSLGVELNADYEHALLRLLAGERDLLRLEPVEAREELRREVEAPYPFVGMFRKYASSDVWVSMEAEPDPSIVAEPPEGTEAHPVRGRAPRPDPDRPEPRFPRVGDGAAGRPSRRGGPIPARATAPVKLHREDAAETEGKLTDAGADCAFCGDALPAGRRVRFCPHCGGDQRLRPCPRCEAVLEREWRYCISCGHDVADA
jgi:Double zinc ribbon